MTLRTTSHHSGHWGINPPPKKKEAPCPLFLAKPPLNQLTVQAPPFLGNAPYIFVFQDPFPPLKVGSFS